jgi:hypothetical protein
MATEDTAKPAKQLEDIFTRLRKDQERQSKASVEAANALNSLSENTVKKLHKQLIELSKSAKILDDEQISLIKNSSDLAEALELQESIKEKEIKADKQKLEIKKKSIKNLIAREAKLDAVGREKLKNAKAEIEIAEKQISESERLLDSWKNQTKSLTEAAIATNSFNTTMLHAKNSAKDWIQRNISYQKSIELLKEATKQSIDELNKATAVGLQSSLYAINRNAMTLKISFDQLSAIVIKNRDIMARLGNGPGGIEKFTSLLKDSSKNLEYMGRDGTLATARFFDTMKTMGIKVDKDSAKFRTAMDKTQRHFAKLSVLYNENYEQYADLMETQLESESIQARLNNASERELEQIHDEIRLRTDNYKAMGLNNEQIKNFSKQLESIYDPHKNNQAQRIQETESTKQEVAALAQRSGSEELKLALPKIMQALDLGGKYGGSPEVVKAALNKLGPEMQAWYNAKASVDKKQGELAANRDSRALTYQMDINTHRDRGGATSKLMNELVTAAGIAKSKGLDTSADANKNAEQAAEDLISGKGDSLYLKTLKEARDLKQQAESITENSLTKGVTGFAAGLAAAVLDLKDFSKWLSISNIAMATNAAATGIRTVLGAVLSPAGIAAAATAALGYLAYKGAEKDAGEKNIAMSSRGDYEQFSSSNRKKQKDFELTSKMIDNSVSSGKISKEEGEKRKQKLAPVYTTIKDKDGKDFRPGIDTPTSHQSIVDQSNLTQSRSEQKPITSGTNEIAKVISMGPGWLSVQRPDGTTEKISGSRNWRNNNPGNIEYGQFAQKNGAIGSDGRFAIFPNYETGRKAKENLIFEGKKYSNLSLTDAINRYAPPSENNTSAYQSKVLASVGGANKKMSDYTTEERGRILDAMQKQEGFKPGTTTAIAMGTPPTAAAVTASSSPTPSSTSSVSMAKTDSLADELRKQTNLLSQIAMNTSTSYKPTIDKRAQKSDPSEEQT